ncbi:MAG: hypothetical protein KKH44_04825 [Bacteroidetes bacterium]|nr:hypothetical protein [Bacteroidota bacterium]
MFANHPEIAKRWTKKYGSKIKPDGRGGGNLLINNNMAKVAKLKKKKVVSNLIQGTSALEKQSLNNFYNKKRTKFWK